MARIVDAAEALFGERGYDGAAIGGIADRAGCSVGAVYARFRDKESLFRHVHAAHCRGLVETAERAAAAPPGPLGLLLGGIALELFRFAEGRRALTRVFIQRSGADRAFHARYAEAWDEVTRALRAALLARGEDISHPEPRAAVDFVLQLLHSLWANDVLHHDRREIAAARSPGELARRFAEVAAGYLGEPIRPEATRSSRSAARA
jgi:AcrR family transcriptional regulator